MAFPTTSSPTDPMQTFEDPAELLAAKRKQELALALMKQLQGGAPQPQQTRILAKTPLSAMLLNVGAQGLAQNNLSQADKQIGDIAKAQQNAYSSGASELLGSPDKKAAIAKALASNNPMLRALAQAQEKAMIEAEQKALDRANTRANAIVPVMGDRGMISEAAEVARTGNVPQGIQAPAPVPPVFGETTLPSGKTVPTTVNTNLKGQQTGTMGAQGNETKIILPSQQQETAAAKAFGEDSPKVLKETRASAEKAIQGLESSGRILSILKDPEVMTGAFAEPRLLLAKVGNLLGITGPEAIGQTQSLMSELANQTLAQVRRLPGAITEKERPFLEMAAAGKLDYTPEAMRRLAEIAQIASHNELIGLKEQYDSATRLPGVAENSGMYPFPKGWNFQPNPDTMEPQGPSSDRWKLKTGSLPIPQKGTAASKALRDMSDEELRQRLKQLKGE